MPREHPKEIEKRPKKKKKNQNQLFQNVEMEVSLKNKCFVQYKSTFPKEERGDIKICHKGDGGGACSHEHILQKFGAGLVNATASHRHKSSRTDISVFLAMKRCKNQAHKIFS